MFSVNHDSASGSIYLAAPPGCGS